MILQSLEKANRHLLRAYKKEPMHLLYFFTTAYTFPCFLVFLFSLFQYVIINKLHKKFFNISLSVQNISHYVFSIISSAMDKPKMMLKFCGVIIVFSDKTSLSKHETHTHVQESRICPFNSKSL